MKKPVALIILDGFGISSSDYGNAIKAARLPNYNRYVNQFPNTTIEASGLAVGLPEGQMGNSEVGHLNIGAGRIVYQELTRISQEIRTGAFYENPVLNTAIEAAKEKGKGLHLMGLLSDGGVHSHTEHLYALLRLAAKKGLQEVYIHCFLDGRDTPPTSALGYMKELLEKLKEIGVGKVATVSGRYYAMDRDNRWDRVKLAYDAMVLGAGRTADCPVKAVEAAYENGENDEFVMPTVILDNGAAHTIDSEDSIIFINFRPDRARQLTRAFMDDEFKGFVREKGIFPLHYVSMTQYDKSIVGVKVAYEPQSLKNTIGEYLSGLGVKQFRIAETEKYAHVTYFFNGGIEAEYPGEDRSLIPSPMVATYDLKPEMSAQEVTEELLKALEENKHDFIVLNFANPDMVGHTGVFDAVVKALETVDSCLGKVVDAILEKSGKVIITSDHGNSEELLDEATGAPVTAHTLNPVPLIIAGVGKVALREGGRLCDIAPTLLDMLGLPKPEEMTGEALIIKG